MMEIADIERLVDIVKNAKISELVVTTGSPQRTIRLRKRISAVSAKQVVNKSVSAAGNSTVLIEPPIDLAANEVFVTAPMVGIFHSIDCIGMVGTSVRAGQVLGSIESMKLMNDVICRFDGTIAESLVEDGMPVEYGHKLFKLETI
jgi:biotin carboxyl carrier protein